LREAQRQLTRSRLVEAAREVFAEKNYVLATVDDIAERARIGRATVYVHFESKKAILLEILREDLRRQDDLYRRLAASPVLSEDALAAWIDRHARGFANRRASLLLFYVTMGLEPEFVGLFNRKREDVFRILGESFPAFRFAEDDHTPATEQRRAEAHLLLFQLAQTSFHLAFPDWNIGRDAVVRVLARNFMRFIQQGDAPT